MKSIAIITPTYNRGNLLSNLYDSLKKQSVQQFSWIIIDDGSTDNTRQIVESFIEEANFEICYYYQNNGGKHRALNRAIEVCNQEMFFIVDSDDWLVETAIEDIILIEKTIDNSEKFAGVAGLKSTLTGNILTEGVTYDKIDMTSLDAFYRYGLTGDKAEVFYTEVLKKFKFPEFSGENFLTEATVWHQIANAGYKIRWFNKVIYIADYLEGGLTKRSFELSQRNPKGKSYFHNLECSYDIPFKQKIYHSANYFRYGIIANFKIKDLYVNCSFKHFRMLAIFMAYVVIIVSNRKIKLIRK